MPAGRDDLNALRVALRIVQGKIILNFGVQKRLRAFLYPIFAGGVVAMNCICSAAFCESAALPFTVRTPFVKMRLERSAERDKRKIK